MKIIGVIPARYESTRLPGKPLAEICGKPMIWWVYQQALKVKGLDDIVVAVDNDMVFDKCIELGINAVITNSEHPSHMHRLLEVANKISSDLYVCICGDEPLIEPNVIESIIPREKVDMNSIYVRGVRRILSDPVEAMDSGNIKIVVDKEGDALALSRTPIPYPYKFLNYTYYKTIGIECFNKLALEFYVKDENPRLTNIPLMNLPIKKNILICCINRQNRIIIPGGQDTIQPGDSVVVVLTNESLNDITDILVN